MIKEQETRIEFTLSRIILAEEQGSIIEVPFEMPERVERFHVSYTVSAVEQGSCIVDLGAKDPTRVRGWSGGARTQYFIGVEQATPGYLPGAVVPGEWAVLLGAYRIPQLGCRVEIVVKCELEHKRWLKGDLHMHSVHSDATLTWEENIRIMEELGCDFVAMTDHNTVSQNYAYPRETKLVLIPGMELTTYHGHCNLLGVTEPIKDFRWAGFEDVQNRICEAKVNGAKVVLNHPHCPNCGWDWDESIDYDWVEIWNGHWREMNQQALDWWHQQLCEGRRIVAVGGSDSHGNGHSMPTTWVYSRACTKEGIMEALDQGHVFVNYAPEGPTLDLTIEKYRMGDVVQVEDLSAKEIQISAAALQQGDIVKIISEKGVELTIDVEDQQVMSWTAGIGNRLFYRVEIWRHFEQVNNVRLAAVSNPIYFR